MFLRAFAGLLALAHMLGSLAAAFGGGLRWTLGLTDLPEILFWSIAAPIWMLYGVALFTICWKSPRRPRLAALTCWFSIICCAVVVTYVTWLAATAPEFDRRSSWIIGGAMAFLYLLVNALALFGLRWQRATHKVIAEVQSSK